MTFAARTAEGWGCMMMRLLMRASTINLQKRDTNRSLQAIICTIFLLPVNGSEMFTMLLAISSRLKNGISKRWR